MSLDLVHVVHVFLASVENVGESGVSTVNDDRNLCVMGGSMKRRQEKVKRNINTSETHRFLTNS